MIQETLCHKINVLIINILRKNKCFNLYTKIDPELMLIFVVCGSICGVRVVEIVITVFLSFNGSIAAYQSLQQEILTAPVQARPVFTVRQVLGSAWSVTSLYCYYQLSLIS